ncbi:hypothetical protein Scep_006980 [Stephania cephalantha]|uniref:Uncharacterized protein n=1 Tax=Stephania cephalantha TaxID=152367 RepID=A0AAP0PKM0_9MAGN
MAIGKSESREIHQVADQAKRRSTSTSEPQRRRREAVTPARRSGNGEGNGMEQRRDGALPDRSIHDETTKVDNEALLRDGLLAKKTRVVCHAVGVHEFWLSRLVTNCLLVCCNSVRSVVILLVQSVVAAIEAATRSSGLPSPSAGDWSLEALPVCSSPHPKPSPFDLCSQPEIASSTVFNGSDDFLNWTNSVDEDAMEKLAPYSALSGDESYSNRDLEKVAELIGFQRCMHSCLEYLEVSLGLEMRRKRYTLKQIESMKNREELHNLFHYTYIEYYILAGRARRLEAWFHSGFGLANPIMGWQSPISVEVLNNCIFVCILFFPIRFVYV